jgi:hypothetical protein
VRATHVDHIVDVLDGGARLDLSHLRRACAACNIGKRNTLVAARARAYRDGTRLESPAPADEPYTEPRWWRWFGSYWDPVSARLSDPAEDLHQVERPTGRGTASARNDP